MNTSPVRALTITALIWLTLPVVINAGGNETFDHFGAAKKAGRLYLSENPYTFYCNCKITGKTVDSSSCGYVSRRDSKRARRIEWEHIVPAENFGRSFQEWREGHTDCVRADGRSYKGRLCARRASPVFNRIEADLYNLVPEIGELNADRRNYSFGIIEGEERAYGRCDFEVSERVVEPRPDIRGDIARIYFYMDDSYPERGILGRKSRTLFETWSQEDPVDKAECRRALWVERIQGNANRFVKDTCLANGWYN